MPPRYRQANAPRARCHRPSVRLVAPANHRKRQAILCAFSPLTEAAGLSPRYSAAIASSAGSLFLTLPARLSTSHITISPAG
jgi:hypothetical protein